jgi:hypothetical protein
MTRFPPSLWLIAVAVVVSSLTRQEPQAARRPEGPPAIPRLLVRAVEQPLPAPRAARLTPPSSGAASPSSRSRP